MFCKNLNIGQVSSQKAFSFQGERMTCCLTLEPLDCLAFPELNARTFYTFLKKTSPQNILNKNLTNNANCVFNSRTKHQWRSSEISTELIKTKKAFPLKSRTLTLQNLELNLEKLHSNESRHGPIKEPPCHDSDTKPSPREEEKSFRRSSQRSQLSYLKKNKRKKHKNYPKCE